jgi:CHAT domain-containing protein
VLQQQIRKEIEHGDLNLALQDADRALNQYAAESPEWDGRFRVLKAEILVSRSAYKETLEVLNVDLPPTLRRTSVAVQRKVFQGIAHRSGQQFAEAQRDFEEAQRLAYPLESKFTSQVLIALAALEVDQGEYGKAEAHDQEALAIAKRASSFSLEVTALGDLARIATGLEHYDEAIDLNRRVLERAHSRDLKSVETTVIGNMGWAYFQLGDFEHALELYKEGAERSEKSGQDGNTAYWFTGVANSYMFLHDYAAAESVAKSTLKRALDLNNAQTITECHNTLAEIMLKTGRPNAAEEHVKEALQWEEKGRDHFGTLQSTLLSARIEAWKQHFSKSQRLFERFTKDKKIAASLKWEAEARLAKLHDDQGLVQQAAQEYKQAVKTIEAAQSAISSDELRLSFLAGAIEFYDDYVDFLVRRGRATDALSVAEQSRARTLAKGLASTNEDAPGLPSDRPQKIAQKLNASLLFYWVGHDQSYLWVITPTKTSYFKLPKAADIEPVVKAYREALPNVDDALDTGASAGNKLYAMLVEPAKKLIPPGSRVILLPAESLYGLNFETLIVSDPKPHFWIEDVTLTTASSLTLLDASTRRSAMTGKGLLLVGNALPTPGFPALAHAPAEMKNVSHYFPDQDRKVLEAKQATATAYFSSNPERYAYLHFVTHGTASRTRPLESAVILSPEGDSYKLYARDVVTHHLNAQLVTISACNTSGNRSISGEGLVGLSWAFLRAGAHNVIGALWEVSDASTPQLMDAFYRELFQGQDTATALRNAKLGLLRSADKDSVFRKPFYWAPFQLYAGS